MTATPSAHAIVIAGATTSAPAGRVAAPPGPARARGAGCSAAIAVRARPTRAKVRIGAATMAASAVRAAT